MIFTDGGSRGNPGIAGCGFVLYEVTENLEDLPQDSTKIADLEPLEEGSVYLKEMTNNQAEYLGLVFALEHATQNYADYNQIRVYMDSELIVKQMNGVYKVKNKDLKVFFEQAKALVKKFEFVEFLHTRRENNKVADKLANEAMDRGE